MQIQNVQIEGYGPLKIQMPLSDGLNVVYGRNESGKSTLHQALEDGLFGFHHKKAEKTPFLSWGSNGLSLRMQLLTTQGEVLLTRELNTKAQCWIERKGNVEKRGNKALEGYPVERALYTKLYRLEQDDLRFLDTAIWDEIQSRLVTQYGLDVFRPPHEVLLEIEQEMAAIYRENHRGKYAVKRIDEEATRARQELRQAFDRDRELESLRREREEKSAQLRAVETQLLHDQSRLTALKSLIPSLQNKKKRKTLLSVLDQYGWACGLVDKISKLDAAIDQVNENVQQLQAQVKAIELEVPKLNPVETRLSMNQSECDQVTSLIARRQELKREKAHAQSDLEKQLAAIRLLHEQVSAEPWASVSAHVWATIHPDDVIWKRQRNGTLMISSMLVTLSALAMCAVGWFMGPPILWATATPLLLSGAGMYAAARKWKGAVKGTPLDLRHVVSKGKDRLRNKLEDIHRQALECVQLEERNAEKTRALHENRKELDHLFGRLQINGQTTAERMGKLQDRLKQLDEKKQKQKASAKVLEQLHGQIRSLREDIRAKEEQRDEMVDQLKNIHINRDRAEEQVRRAEMAKRQLEELPVIAETEEEISMEEAEEQLTATELNIERRRAQREEVRVALAGIDQQLESGGKNQEIQRLQSRIKVLDEQRKDRMKRWNKLRTMKHLLELTDQYFHANHQPELIERASDLFSTFTGGQYDRIYVSENREQLQLRTVNGRLIDDPNTLSRGAQEQLYMALRLAMLKTVEGDEPMPLLLDEVFVNWDCDRRRNGLSALAQIAAERQVVLTTCHTWLVDELRANEIPFTEIQLEGYNNGKTS